MIAAIGSSSSSQFAFRRASSMRASRHPTCVFGAFVEFLLLDGP